MTKDNQKIEITTQTTEIKQPEKRALRALTLEQLADVSGGEYRYIPHAGH